MSFPFAFWKGGAPAFDPATLALSGWWRASYAGAPWTPTASAGGSGGNGSLVAGTAPATGTTLNGYTPADFNGSSHALTAGACSTFYATAAGSMSLLVKPASTVVAASLGYDEPTVFGADQACPGITYTTSGFGFVLYDGAYQVAYKAAASGSYHSVQMKWDSSNIRYRVDSGGWTNLAAGAMNFSGGTLLVGTNYAYAAYFQGLLADSILADTALSDATMDSIKSYYNARYSLSL